MKVAVVGKVGTVEERLTIGPALLARWRHWNEAGLLVALCQAAGAEAWAVGPLDNTGPEPDWWLLADVPRAALIAGGLHARIAHAVRLGRGRLLMLGGCLSLGGQQGAGGWHDDDLLPVTSAGDDTVECVEGVVADGQGACPSWTSFGYNRVLARPGATVRARFGPDPAWVTSADGHVQVWCSDLLPHWGPRKSDAAISGWLAEMFGQGETA